MQSTPIAPHLSALAPDFARRFALIAADLVAVIARVFLRNPRLVPLIIPLCTRFFRATRRCNTFMATLATGHLPRHREPGPSGRPARSGSGAPVHAPAPKIPRTEAWLVHTLRHEASNYASQLAHLLAEPAITELLAAAPTTARFLNPICRMLGVPRHEVKRSGVNSDRGVLAPRERSPVPTHPPSSWPVAPLAMRPPPCPHVGWPWFPRPATKPA